MDSLADSEVYIKVFLSVEQSLYRLYNRSRV